MIRLLILFSILLHQCDASQKSISSLEEEQEQNQSVKKDVSNIYLRFPPEKGYTRISEDSTSFTSYLRNLPLKPKKSLVKLYNGNPKYNNNVYCAVVALPIGNKDLHQCADAVIRLKAEHLWTHKQYDKIVFKLTNGFSVPYSRWIDGDRVKVVGNTTSWVNRAAAANTYKTFWSYLEFVFMYAGTASLSKELNAKPLQEACAGDVFIQGGFPGHAVIILDEIVDKVGRKKFLLGQSYMPAQEIQVLCNPQSQLSPWYTFDDVDQIVTPEWTFELSDLKSFRSD